MEVTGSASVRGAVPDWSRAALLREPLFWAALAAFAGAVIGLFGTVRQAALGDAFYVDPAAQLLAQVPQFLGEGLVMSSTLGAVYLAWRALRETGRRLALLGAALLALLLLAEAVGIASSVYWSTGERWQGYAPFPFPGLEVASSYAIAFLPPVVLLPFAALALAAREGRTGGLISALLILSVPFGAVRYWLAPPEPTGRVEPTTELLASVLGWYPSGVGLLEAPLWVLFGVLLLRRARSRAGGEAFRVGERENLEAARRLYEDGLGRGDASVVDELVRTRVVLSGTDRGGVLWYPPTGRRATFVAEFIDRFRDGRLVEHTGEADTEGLLRQLGLAEIHEIPPHAPVSE